MVLSIWYASNLQRCNFRCSYCTTQQPSLQTAGPSPTWRFSRQVHEAVVDWLIAQPYRIRLRMNSLGEPFVSQDYLDSVARLTRAENIAFVEILTNGSCRPKQFDKMTMGCDLSKLSLWMTFHHPFIAAADLVEAAAHAQQRGAFVVVNALVFPDNVDAVRALVALCAEKGVRIATGAGVNENGAYPNRGHVPALAPPVAGAAELVAHQNPLGILHHLSARPRGHRCGAGNGYWYIRPDGSLFPCGAYATATAAGVMQACVGSVLDPDFRLEPPSDTWRPCALPGRCASTEDYQHLEAIQTRFAWPLPSFCLPVRKTNEAVLSNSVGTPGEFQGSNGCGVV